MDIRTVLNLNTKNVTLKIKLMYQTNTLNVCSTMVLILNNFFEKKFHFSIMHKFVLNDLHLNLYCKNDSIKQ